MSDTQTKAEKHFGNRKFFIVEKYVGYQTERYNIHNQKMYSYHLQEVDTSMVEQPLVLTDEVKEEQSEMPF
jgi:ribosomal protein S9